MEPVPRSNWRPATPGTTRPAYTTRPKPRLGGRKHYEVKQDAEDRARRGRPYKSTPWGGAGSGWTKGNIRRGFEK
jgi:hypothetical protein